MSCKPKGLNSSEIAASAQAEILKGRNLVKKDSVTPYITSYQIGSNPDGKSIFQEQLKDAPKAYQQAKAAPVILSILTVLAGVGVVFLSSTWEKGLRHLGIILVVVGILMLLFSWSLNRGVNKQLVPKIKTDNLLLQTDLRNLTTDLTDQIHSNYLLFGGIYTATGIIAIAGAETIMRRSQPKPDAAGIAAPSLAGNAEPKPKTRSKLKRKT
jgi:hypothetical protein